MDFLLGLLVYCGPTAAFLFICWFISFICETIRKFKLLKELQAKLPELEKYNSELQLELSKIKQNALKIEDSIQKDYDQLKSDHSDIYTYVATLMADYYTHNIFLHEQALMYSPKKHERQRIVHVREVREEAQKIITEIKASQYHLKDQINILHQHFLKSSASNLTAIPYMAAIMADYETHGVEMLATQLDWGNSVERAKKVASIREIRKATQQMIERNMEAKYQLEYLLSMFPNLQDIIETDYNELPVVKIEELSDYDRSRDWLSKEEYQKLKSAERNQLALDRYKASHNKTKWQIGRDYELYVGYKYGQKGYTVDYFGSYMGLEDLGRDLIAKKDDKILIIQCKYWSKDKQIHEKHITQLYGTVASYCIENNLPKDAVKGLLITNISLSDMAKKMASYLNVDFVENYPIDDYPCIKCNIGHGENGPTKIYHLPFDQQYDITKIDAPGEFFAMTVKEAEKAGFRRAFKWFGNN